MDFLQNMDVTTWAAIGAGVVVVLIAVVVLVRSLAAPGTKKQKLARAPASRGSLTPAKAATAPASRPAMSGAATAKPAPTDSAKPAAASNVAITMDFAKGGAHRFKTNYGVEPEAGAIAGGCLIALPQAGYYSIDTTPAKAGETWRVEWSVKALADSTNGGPNNFFVGPLARNEGGDIVQWWSEQLPVSISDGVRSGKADLLVAPGATTVGIGINGNYSAAGSGNGEIGFLSLSLRRVD